jgi:predicted metal-binding membrane protein
MSYQGTLKRERKLVLWAMVSLAALAWAYTVYLGVQHQSMVDTMAAPMTMQWSTADVIFMFFMWAVMMFAMMLPSVTPTVLIFGRVREKRRVAGQNFAPTGAFVLGYLLVWAGFSLLATIVNWSLHTGGLMPAIIGNVGPPTRGLLLVAAGVFQWTPLKNACLDHCRSPMSFLMQHWREGSSGAILMGLHHGIYCLGCCWFLMALLFAGGVMNLYWIAGLALFVLIEKLVSGGVLFGRVTGGGLIIAGIALLVL